MGEVQAVIAVQAAWVELKKKEKRWTSVVVTRIPNYEKKKSCELTPKKETRKKSREGTGEKKETRGKLQRDLRKIKFDVLAQETELVVVSPAQSAIMYWPLGQEQAGNI